MVSTFVSSMCIVLVCVSVKLCCGGQQAAGAVGGTKAGALSTVNSLPTTSLVAGAPSLLPRVHAPVALLHVASARHVTFGAGKPAKPALHTAVQLEPAVVLGEQLKEPPGGFSGAVLQTAHRRS